MVFRLILVLWIYQLFFAERDTEAIVRFILSLPEELIILNALCVLALMPLVLIGIPLYFGFLRVSGVLHGIFMAAFALLATPILLINFWFMEGADSIASFFLLLGIFCNCLAVVGNKGKMPVSKEVLEKRAGQEIDPKLSDEEIFRDSRHSLARGQVRFPWLIDRFHYSLVVKGIFSVGDALIWIGLITSLFPKF